jgi:hypothetical protein
MINYIYLISSIIIICYYLLLALSDNKGPIYFCYYLEKWYSQTIYKSTISPDNNKSKEYYLLLLTLLY